MKKAIVVIRTSTVRQEIEAQKIEIIEYAKSFNYSEDEIVVIGERGASAIKLDEAYMKNLDIIYKTIEDNPIECVFCWQLDRLGRDEVVMIAIKNFLIDHQVQLRVKNPTLYLLNEDGTVNSGMELAISLFITMAKQEMKTKKARFTRAKQDIAAKGKFIGARYMLFGYTTNKEGYLVIDDEKSKIVKMIFDMYCTEKYSCANIAKELNDRGIKLDKRKFNEGNIVNILKNTAYVGYLDRNKLVKNYPRIISDEQFTQVKRIRESRNKNFVKKTKHISLALKILKCWECNSNYMRYQSSTDIRYICLKRQQARRYEESQKCRNSCYVQVSAMDEILQDLAFNLKAKNNNLMSKTRIKELRDKLVVLQEKMDNSVNELSKIEDKFAKAYDAWESEILNKKQYDARIEKLKAERDNLTISITQYQNEYDSICETLSRADRVMSPDEMMDNMVKDYIENTEEKDKTVIKGVIDKYIKVAYPKAIKVNDINLTLIMVVDYDNNIYNYVFHQKHGKKEGLFVFDNNVLKPYPHKVLMAMDNGNIVMDKRNSGIGDAMATIIASNDLMADLTRQIEDLNNILRERI